MEQQKLTPLEVEILLWYHHSPEDHKNIGSIPGQMAASKFCQAGILVEYNNRQPKYEPVRPALDLYVNAICSIPLPKQIWILPENEKQ